MTDMRIKYWGVRGSIPTPLTTEEIIQKEFALISQLLKDGGTEKVFKDGSLSKDIRAYIEKQSLSISGTYGGNTTCIEVQAKDSPLIMIDSGTGARALGQNLAKKLFSNEIFNPLEEDPDSVSSKEELHLFFTHYHWDHLQGFPFFAPGFIPEPKDSRIIFYGRRDATKQLSDVLAGQQQYPHFPVVWIDMPCEKDYKKLGRMEPKEFGVGKTRINYTELNHPDITFGYSIECNGKKFVVATDTEPRKDLDVKLLKLAQNADVMYYDGQYTPEELNDKRMPKQGWGHGTYEDGIDTAIEAGVKKLVLGHHEPTRNDFELETLGRKAQVYLEGALARAQLPRDALTVEMAYEGMTQEL